VFVDAPALDSGGKDIEKRRLQAVEQSASHDEADILS